MSFTPGQILYDRYRVDALLGQGGMGAVYEAWDVRLNIRCALKENLLFTESAQRQFEREARLLATLRHPHLPRVSDHFVIPGQGQYLVMDFVEGEDLRHRLERLGALPEVEVYRWATEILDALAYLHQRNIIHRDIKPANIKVTADHRAMLVDFGIAKQMDAASGLTTTGAQGLTPGFAPPEQYGMGRTEPYSDVYAFGATLYILLTNEVPADALSRLTKPDKFVPLVRRQPLVAPTMAAIIDKALAMEPSERYANGSEMLATLRGSQTQPAPLAATTAPSAPAPITVTPLPAAPTRIAASAGTAQLGAASQPSRAWLPWVLGGAALVVVLGLGAVIAALNWPTLIAAASTTTPSPSPTLTIPSTATVTSPPPATATTSPTSTATAAPTPFGGGGGLIAFATNRDAGGNLKEVYVMNVDGSNPTRLTESPTDNEYPRWSPDGQRLLFFSFREGNAEVYVMSADGTGVRNLTENPGQDFDAVWSPDGARILFTSLRDNQREIYVMNADGSGQTNLTNNPAEDAYSEWSPDGSLILFQSDRDGNQELYVMKPDGTEVSRLTNHPGYDGHPYWSPDQQYIAFISDRDGNLELYRIRANGSDSTRLTNNTAQDMYPSWSPDGTLLAFMTDRDGDFEIYILDVAAVLAGQDGERRVTDHPESDGNPIWQP
jgi:Tol biopolymer transport system component